VVSLPRLSIGFEYIGQRPVTVPGRFGDASSACLLYKTQLSGGETMSRAHPGDTPKPVTNSKMFGHVIFNIGVALCLLSVGTCPTLAGSGHEFAFCSGYFALCDASTCTPTGRKITVNVTGGGTARFPEANCTCPIFSGTALADLAGGNMQGSCAPPSTPNGSVGIWSLYAYKFHIAQQITGWVPTGPKALAPFLHCAKSLDLGNTMTNCFSFACDSQTYTDTGVPVATCHCPLGESLDGTPIAPHTAFMSRAGQGNQRFCAKHPVGRPGSSPMP
jgi:hypothetical protein